MNNPNKPWNQPKSSPGFIYYDTTPTKESNDGGNLDFIEFSNTGSPHGQFSPGSYSSPTNNFRQRNGRYSDNNRSMNRGFNRSRSNYNSRSFNNRHQNSRDSTNNSPNTSYGSFNNTRYSPYDRPKYDRNDISQYVDSSMVQNPWMQLQKDLEKDIEATSQSDSDQERNSVAALKRFDLEKDSGSQCESTDSQEDQISAESS